MAITNYTESQKKANEMFSNEQAILLTGKPGTGKTELVEDYRERQAALGKKILVTASTGLAASNLSGGRTIHSALKWNPKAEAYDYDRCVELLKDTDILIIDEVSMMDASITNHLYHCLQHVDRKPQIIMSGDFFQLPPVTKKGEFRTYPFELASWKALGLRPCVLDDVVRQRDPEFKRMLERAMLGDKTCIPYFNNNSQQRLIEGAIILCTTNDFADFYNRTMLANLPGVAKSYFATGDVVGADFEHSRVEKCLSLKLNMRVMALRNDPAGNYQNGSLGIVVDMTEDSIKVMFDNGVVADIHRVQYEIDKTKGSTEMAKINQFPLLGGYAITIHKSQGQTFDCINIKAPSCWDPGQLYVALSRARSVKGIHLVEPIKPKSLITDPKVIAYYKSLCEGYAA